MLLIHQNLKENFLSLSFIPQNFLLNNSFFIEPIILIKKKMIILHFNKDFIKIPFPINN